MLSETEASHLLQNSEVSSRWGGSAAAHGLTGATPANCAGLRDRSFHEAKDSGLLCKFHSPAPTVLIFITPKFHLQGKSSVYRRENLFLKALIVLAIIGAISVKRKIRPLFQIRGTLHTYHQCFTIKAKVSSLLVLHHQTNGCKWQQSANSAVKASAQH